MEEITIKKCRYCNTKEPLTVVLKAYSETRMRVMCRHCGHEIMLDKNKKGEWE